MTLEEQTIIDAIWGEDAEDLSNEELQRITNGIFAMADIMKERMDAGKIPIAPPLTLQ
jgi:hypothetical protein